MKALLQQIIELLRKRVKENLDTINHNQGEIKQLLNEPVSAERTYHIEKHYDVNKFLLSENNDFINLQITLINFLDKYKDSPIMEEEEHLPIITTQSLDDYELFEMTIQEKLSFDLSHPKFDDPEFFRKLVNYYASLEAYEKCDALLKLKNGQS
jgi:hypothetical protein